MAYQAELFYLFNNLFCWKHYRFVKELYFNKLIQEGEKIFTLNIGLPNFILNKAY